MKTNKFLILIFTLASTWLAAQTHNVNGNWIYNPTQTIKTLTATQDGIQSIVDGDDNILYFKKVGTNKYQCSSKPKLYLEFKSNDLHLQYNTGSGKQNTWTRYGAVPTGQQSPTITTNTPSKQNNRNNSSSSNSSSGSGFNEIGTKGTRPYNHAIGLRAGFPTSVTYKKFMNDTKAFEVFGGINAAWFNFGAYYQFHRELNILDEVFPWVEKGQWYFGIGVSGFSFRNQFNFSGFENSISIAPTGILGWSYNIKGLPISVGGDIQPTFALGGKDAFTGFGGFGVYGGGYIRYIIN